MSSNDTGTGMVTPHAIDRYWVEGLVGRGGFGAVYRARHVHTKQLVALKVLRPSALSAGQTPNHLVREAQILATIRHRNIVQVFDAGVADGMAFFAMELVDGASVEQLLTQTRAMPIPMVLSLAGQLLEGLAAAHAVGVVHRDIKPGNLLVLADGTLKILDFGISKSSLVQVSAVSQGSWVGTPGYMAPEQYGGSPVDLRADLYAAAVTIYRMAAGERPFPESNFAELLSRVMRERAPSLSTKLPNAPLPLVQALDRALARDPDGRFASADEFRAALTSQASVDATGATQSAGPYSPRTEMMPRISSRPPAPLGPSPMAGATPVSAYPFASQPPSTFAPQGPPTTAGAPTATQVSAPSGKPAGWLILGGLFAAMLVVGGVLLGVLLVREKHENTAAAARPEASNAPRTGGVVIGPVATVTRTGTFTTTQICKDNESIRYEKATFDVKEGPALIAEDNCDLFLIDSVIRAPVGVRGTNGDIVMRGGSVTAEKVGFELTNTSDLTLDGTTVRAPDGIRVDGPSTVALTKSKILVTDTGLAFSNTNAKITDTEVSGGFTALRTSATGTIVLHGGSLSGSRWALDLGGLADLTVEGTRVDGPTRRDPLVSVRGLPGMAAAGPRAALDPVPTAGPSATPTAAPSSSGSAPGPKAGAAVVRPGISIFYPLTVPQGLDPKAFVAVASAAATPARACLSTGETTTVRIQIMVSGPEIPANDHKIALLQPSADNTGTPAVARCVAEAFRRVVPNPWPAAKETRIIHFDVRLGP
jgi:serine/threonine-protein kinase